MNLADGEWHRLHPATPLLRGGIAFVAIVGFVIANLRERLLDLFFGVPQYGEDPIDEILRRGLVGWALLAVFVVLVAVIVVFYLSWRVHSFRVTDEVVEVRSGLLSRTHRRARLDRIQGVSITRPLLARIFGAAKIDITVAGNDANVQLAYLASRQADELRREILTLASGVVAERRARLAAAEPGTATEIADSAATPTAGTENGVASAAPARGPGFSDVVRDRVDEFLAPELDPDAAPPASVVRIPIGRLIGSVVLNGFTVFLMAMIIAIIIGVANGAYWPIFAVLPVLLGGFSFYVNRTTRQLRYSIAGTPDGVRVGYGLLSTNNETLPPGRIHAIGVSQPLLWRPFGWWRLQVNTAGRGGSDRQNRENTTVLPVGDREDVRRVLELILPAFTDAGAEGVVEIGLTSRGGSDGFDNAPRRAAWLRPFSWRRTGYRRHAGVLLLRHGVLARELAVVPLARLQSVGMHQGPIQRMLRLASVQLHTVAGPVRAVLEVADAAVALAVFERTAADAVSFAGMDTSHHWGSA
ncbi:PH domain-containing protein [Rathayibacter sp. YIM 133350]|uniref:PH domain-containing protein n=1 Tax=Rathayibacter sp. YIM 133350 TaxID=3131992 RepID=UPI00307E3628